METQKKCLEKEGRGRWKGEESSIMSLGEVCYEVPLAGVPRGQSWKTPRVWGDQQHAKARDKATSRHKPFPTSEDVRRRMLLPFHKQVHEDIDLSPHTQTEWGSTISYINSTRILRSLLPGWKKPSPTFLLIPSISRDVSGISLGMKVIWSFFCNYQWFVQSTPSREPPPTPHRPATVYSTWPLWV